MLYKCKFSLVVVLISNGYTQSSYTMKCIIVQAHYNRRSSEIQGTALSKCLQAGPVYTGPCLQV